VQLLMMSDLWYSKDFMGDGMRVSFRVVVFVSKDEQTLEGYALQVYGQKRAL